MRKMFGFCAIISLMLCSCASVKTVTYSEMRTVEPTQCMHAVPLIADLQVSESRITYTERIDVDLTSLPENDIKNFIENLKSTVLFRALKQYNAEVMVAPIIDVQDKARKVLAITITGYPATYKNIRSATKDDSWFIPITKPEEQAVASPIQNGFKLFNK